MAVLPQVAQLRGKVLDFLFPRWCVGCGKEGDFICSSCRSSLSWVVPPVCPRCGVPQPDGNLCPGCHNQQMTIDGIRSPFRFEGVIRQAVHQLKYQNLRAIAAPLALFLADYLASNPVPGEVLVPVPLHPKRLRERGYNQSELLAKELSKFTQLLLVADCLTRERPSPPQVRAATLEERQSNVKGAFNCFDDRLRGKPVLLIDDVSTSGATLNACAAALKAHGALSVWGLTLAREI